jgi:hypothetical protein
MRWLCVALLLVGLAVGGCQATKPKSFAPFEARLELIHGGARHFVLVNSSGGELHNYSFSAYMYDDNAHRLFRQHPVGMFVGSGRTLKADETLRFHRSAETGESIILAVSSVELVGHCDEGRFHQFWRKADSGQLQLVCDATKPVQP